jgi:hypothetical protein
MRATRMLIVAVVLGAAFVGMRARSQGRTVEAAAGNGSGGTAPSLAAQEQVAEPLARITEEEQAEGFVALLRESENGSFNKHGWNHYGPGYFTLDRDSGVLTSYGGMGLLWYSAETFADFTLRLEFKTSVPESNSGVFVRVPEVVTSDEYIYHSFEIQIDDAAEETIHRTGGVYDAEGPTEDRANGPGEWNEMEVSFVGDRITVLLNGSQVVDWRAEPRGKIRDFAQSGYIGLQNHDWDNSTQFRNVRVKRLD